MSFFQRWLENLMRSEESQPGNVAESANALASEESDIARVLRVFGDDSDPCAPPEPDDTDDPGSQEEAGEDPPPQQAPVKSIVDIFPILEITAPNRQSAYRELTLIDQSLFLNPNIDNFPSRNLDPDQLLLTAKRDLENPDPDAPIDYFRFITGKVWTYIPHSNDTDLDGEVFLNSEMPLRANPPPPYREPGTPGAHLDVIREDHRCLLRVRDDLEYGFKVEENFILPYRPPADNGAVPLTEEEIENSARSTRRIVRALFQATDYNIGNKEFHDRVFSSDAAFIKQELDNVNLSQFTSADISLVFNEDDPKTHPDQRRLSLYRHYWHQMNYGGEIEFCDFEDKIQKFTCENVIQLDEINNWKEALYFGKYINIEINTQQGSRIADLLRKYRMDKYILEAVSGVNLDISEPDSDLFGTRNHHPGDHNEKFTQVMDQTSEFRERSNWIGERLGLSPSTNESFIEGTKKKVINWPLTGLSLERVSHQGPAGKSYVDVIYENSNEYPLKFHGFRSDLENNNKPLVRFWDIVRSSQFYGAMYSYLFPPNLTINDGVLVPVGLENHFRPYGEILKGRKAHSEVIGYKICKYNAADVTYTRESGIEKINRLPAEAIQEFYLMDNTDTQIINFRDTQISNNKEYEYIIYSLNFVVGTSYRYSISREDTANRSGIRDIVSSVEYLELNPNTGEYEQRRDSPGYRLEVASSPKIQIIETPFFRKKIKVLDSPPLSPQVTFLPNSRSENTIQILIQVNEGEYKEVPIEILETDSEIIEGMLISQDPDSEGKIKYKTNSVPDQFQIIRIKRDRSASPTSYEDFSYDNEIFNLDVSAKSTIHQELNLEPNCEYYYIFRTISDGGISNPTPVYRVSINSYENGIFLDVSIHPMVQERTKVKHEFMRYVKITPAYENRTLNYRNPSSRTLRITAPQLEDVTLGPDEKNIWNNNRKFKIRVVSKNTCKVVDIEWKLELNKENIERIEEQIQETNEDPCNPPTGPARQRPGAPPPADDRSWPGEEAPSERDRQRAQERAAAEERGRENQGPDRSNNASDVAYD